jgi:hypothetical protein
MRSHPLTTARRIEADQPFRREAERIFFVDRRDIVGWVEIGVVFGLVFLSSAMK